MSEFSHLLAPGQLGNCQIPNRVLMAPMTRFRVSTEGVPLKSNSLYYSQRASAGLIITESLYVEPRGIQESVTAGIYSREQIDAWREITNSVHESGGRIFAQLAHAGRLSHPSLQPDQQAPIAPSATAQGVMNRLVDPESGEVQYVPATEPRALETLEVQAMVMEFAAAAERALAAGFDGVEIHAGSGHLHRQFLQQSSNQRTDQYGGSAANRTRFVLETLEAVCDAIGPGNVGIKLAPNFAYNGMTGDAAETAETYPLLCAGLAGFGLAYVHVQNPLWGMSFGAEDYQPVEHIRSCYAQTLLAGGEYDRHSGEAAIRDGQCDAVVFGRRFVANPDLPKRFSLNAEENSWDEESLYTPGDTGFTDYATLDESD